MADTPNGVRKVSSYLSFLLRLWNEGEASNCWWASLESVETASRIGFSSLEALFEYICQITGYQLSSAGNVEAKAKEVKEEN